MAKKTVFVSFDYDHDRNYKSLLQAWDANPDFDFSFSDRSITKPINSIDESRIKAAITTKMHTSKYCLVLIGKETYKSEWVTWEIENAYKLGLKLIAVKIDQSFKTPDALYNKNASWAHYGRDSILRALKEDEQKKS